MKFISILLFSFLFFNFQIIDAEVYFNVNIAPAPNWANCSGYSRCWDTPWGIGWPFYGYGYGPGYAFTPQAVAYPKPTRITPYLYKKTSNPNIKPDQEDSFFESDNEQDSMD